MLGLVLTAGGARGAYQAGVLKRLGEIPSLRDRPSPFSIVAGASAGAINGSLLAARGARLSDATREIARIWSELRVEQVFRTDGRALARTGLSLARDFVLGGLLGHTGTRALFDTAPLAQLIEGIFPPRGIADAIRRGRLYAVAITATSYHSGRSFTFIQGRPGHPVWVKSRRVVLPVTLNHRHVLASSAIPAVFPPVRVATEAGELWFGDGGLRLVTPLSPAIRLGATHLLALGVRSSRAADALAREEAGAVLVPTDAGAQLPCPPLAQVLGVFMNAIFLDHLDADLDHLRRMNELVAKAPHVEGASEPMRVVTPLLISPSEDLALIAQRFAHRMPRVVRYLLEGLGTPDAQSADLMSYLLFDGAYTRALVDVGYQDAGERVAEIEAMVRAAPAIATEPAPVRAAVRPTRAREPGRPRPR
ncbi:MAG: patatin-like phospholipase family protein, partial [Candidatus Limnocylindria bacterium]